MLAATVGWWRLTLLAVFFVGLNLRPSIISVPPLLPSIQPDLDLSASLAGLLSSLPVFLLGVSALMVVRLTRRVSPARAIVATMLVLATAIAVRSLAVVLGWGASALFIGTVPVGISIGVAQALILVVIKQLPPRNHAFASGLLSLAVCTGGALGAASAQPLAMMLGRWEWSLAVWAIPAALCAVFCSRLTFSTPVSAGHGSERSALSAVLTHPIAWALCLHMAFQSLLSHATATWLPSLLQERGVPVAEAGVMLSALMVAQLVTALGGAWFASRYRSQGGVVVVMYLLALAGIIVSCQLSGGWLWAGALLLGLGQGGTYSIGVFLIVLRSANSTVTAQLTGMTQIIGYGLAAPGPWLFGMLRDTTGSWGFVVPLFTCVTLAGMASAILAGRNRVIGVLDRPPSQGHGG